MAERLQFILEFDEKGEASVRRSTQSLRGLKDQASATKAVLGGFDAGMARVIGTLYLMERGLNVVKGAWAGTFGRVAATGEELQGLSRRLQVPVSTLTAFGYAAKLAGVSMEDVGTGVRKLNGALLESAKVGSDANKVLVQQLGFTKAQVEAFTKDPTKALVAIARAFNQYEDGAGKAIAAQALFGRSYQGMLQLFAEGADTIEANIKAGKRLTSAWNNDVSDAADRLGDSFTTVADAGRALVDKVFADERVLTAFAESAESISEAMLRLRDNIPDDAIDQFATLIRDAAQDVQDFVDNLDAEQAGRNFASGVSTAADSIRQVAASIDSLLTTVQAAIGAGAAGAIVAMLLGGPVGLTAVTAATVAGAGAFAYKKLAGGGLPGVSMSSGEGGGFDPLWFVNRNKHLHPDAVVQPSPDFSVATGVNGQSIEGVTGGRLGRRGVFADPTANANAGKKGGLGADLGVGGGGGGDSAKQAADDADKLKELRSQVDELRRGLPDFTVKLNDTAAGFRSLANEARPLVREKMLLEIFRDVDKQIADARGELEAFKNPLKTVDTQVAEMLRHMGLAGNEAAKVAPKLKELFTVRNATDALRLQRQYTQGIEEMVNPTSRFRHETDLAVEEVEKLGRADLEPMVRQFYSLKQATETFGETFDAVAGGVIEGLSNMVDGTGSFKDGLSGIVSSLRSIGNKGLLDGLKSGATSLLQTQLGSDGTVAPNSVLGSLGFAGQTGGQVGSSLTAIIGAATTIYSVVQDTQRKIDKLDHVTLGGTKQATNLRIASGVAIGAGATIGAGVGAAAGTVVFPGIGTIVGAVGGAVVGAIVAGTVAKTVTGVITGSTRKAAEDGYKQAQLNREVRTDNKVAALNRFLSLGVSDTPLGNQFADVLLSMFIPSIDKLFQKMFLRRSGEAGLGIDLKAGTGTPPRAFNADRPQARLFAQLAAAQIGAGYNNPNRVERYINLVLNTLAKAGNGAAAAMTQLDGAIRGLFGNRLSGAVALAQNIGILGGSNQTGLVRAFGPSLPGVDTNAVINTLTVGKFNPNSKAAKAGREAIGGLLGEAFQAGNTDDAMRSFRTKLTQTVIGAFSDGMTKAILNTPIGDLLTDVFRQIREDVKRLSKRGFTAKNTSRFETDLLTTTTRMQTLFTEMGPLLTKLFDAERKLQQQLLGIQIGDALATGRTGEAQELVQGALATQLERRNRFTALRAGVDSRVAILQAGGGTAANEAVLAALRLTRERAQAGVTAQIAHRTERSVGLALDRLQAFADARLAELEAEVDLSRQLRDYWRGIKESFKALQYQTDVLRRGPLAQRARLPQLQQEIEALLPAALKTDGSETTQRALADVLTKTQQLLELGQQVYGPGSFQFTALLKYVDSIAQRGVDLATTQEDAASAKLDELLGESGSFKQFITPLIDYYNDRNTDEITTGFQSIVDALIGSGGSLTVVGALQALGAGMGIDMGPATPPFDLTDYYENRFGQGIMARQDTSGQAGAATAQARVVGPGVTVQVGDVNVTVSGASDPAKMAKAVAVALQKRLAPELQVELGRLGR